MTFWFEMSDVWWFYVAFFAVVNLTLIDLPGLTKVAVGKPQYISQYGFTNWLVFWEDSSESDIMKICRGTTGEYCSRYWKYGPFLCWEGN